MNKMQRITDINIVGLTGMSGAGKSTVSSEFILNGFFAIDCDVLAHFVQCEPVFLKELSENFEEELLNDDKTLNRAKTAEVVFSDPKKNRKYFDIIFPFITYRLLELIRLTDSANILLDAPTLFEAKLDILCSHIVSVVADRETCIKRITERDGITEAQALARLGAQHDEEFFRARSDYIIENNGDDLNEVEEAVFEIAKKIRKGE